MPSSYLNAFACLSASGDTEALYRDYLTGHVPLRLVRWESGDKKKEMLLGQVPEALLGLRGDAFTLGYVERWKAGLQALLEEMKKRTSSLSFDAVIVGRGRTKTFNPTLYSQEFANFLSSRESMDWLSKELASRGYGSPSVTFLETSCISGITELMWAHQRIQHKKWRRVLLLSLDPLTPTGYYVMQGVGVISRGLTSDFPRVYHAEREGFARGEAFCAAVVSDQHELGAEAALRIRSVALSNDASGLTAMDADGIGLKSCIQRCLANANTSATQLSFIKTHGTGTVMNDRTESDVFRSLDLSPVPAVSFKSQFGHTTNASGIFELGLAANCMRRGVLRKVLNSEPQDPAIQINVVHANLEKKDLNLCLGIAMGFGGLNGSYLLEKALA